MTPREIQQYISNLIGEEYFRINEDGLWEVTTWTFVEEEIIYDHSRQDYFLTGKLQFKDRILEGEVKMHKTSIETLLGGLNTSYLAGISEAVIKDSTLATKNIKPFKF